jgi:hypothetical protein
VVQQGDMVTVAMPDETADRVPDSLVELAPDAPHIDCPVRDGTCPGTPR